MCKVKAIPQYNHFKAHFPFPNCINVPKDRFGWQWKQMDRARYPSYNANQSAFRSVLQSMHEAAVDQFTQAFMLDQGIGRAQDFIRNNGQDFLEPVYRSVYERTGAEFATGLAQNFKNVKQEEPTAEELAEEEEEEDLRNLALLAIRDFFTTFMFGRINNVVQTNAKEIGIQLGLATRKVLGVPGDEPLPRVTSTENINAISIAARQNLKNYYVNKAATMSVTETVAASNLGLLTAARSLRIPLFKMWLSQRDKRVRDTHVIADGQTVGLNDFFNVGGAQLQFPGDFTHGAPADEIVHCRCVLLFFTP